MTDAGTQPTSYCAHCGAPNPAGTAACVLCGTPLPGTLPAAPPAPEAAAPPAAPGYIVYPPPGELLPAPGGGVAPGYPSAGVPATGPAYAAYTAPAPARPARAGLWIGLALGLLAGLCLLIFAGGAVLVVLRPNLFVAATPTPLDPTALIDQALAAEGQQKAMHYLLTGDFPASMQARLPGHLSLEGDVVPPDSYTMHSNVYGESIVIGGDRYFRAPDTTAWQHTQAPPGQSDFVSNPTELLHFLKYYDPGSVALGEIVVSGTTHLQQVRFDVDLARMASDEGSSSPGAVLAGAAVQGSVRLDSATHLIDRLVLLITLPQSDSATLTLELSRYGVPVTIAPPPGAVQ